MLTWGPKICRFLKYPNCKIYQSSLKIRNVLLKLTFLLQCYVFVFFVFLKKHVLLSVFSQFCASLSLPRWQMPSSSRGYCGLSSSPAKTACQLTTFSRSTGHCVERTSHWRSWASQSSRTTSEAFPPLWNLSTAWVRWVYCLKNVFPLHYCLIKELGDV